MTERKTVPIVLCSDGGADRSGQAAGACLLQTADGATAGLIVYLGEATNNEAEICAGLLGFSWLCACHAAAPLGKVRWICDSEYVLKSATAYIRNWEKNGWKTADKKPVKNQGLWRAFLRLSAGCEIDPKHVRGHTGHA
ncbi:MAG TPA: hypothetical protein PLP17_10200, partial [Oligoflexia bacterium]|nr:hypothetical protein [Oligoflexia bacterium]